MGADAALALGGHRAPELIAMRVGNWAPAANGATFFDGCWNPAGGFFRLELAFRGLLNPPGRVGLSTPTHAPFEFGPHPVSGFIEIDVDDNVATGGDFETPENMYPANVARFGGLPANPDLADRVAPLGVDFIEFLPQTPLVERAGEEFHIALFGDLIDTSIEVEGDGDRRFEADETWIIRGKLLHRAHGYEIFSGANGNGAYEPVVDIEFRHSSTPDVTILSLVYPLTNAAAAAFTGNAPQAPDSSSLNQNSILEGLLDLTTSLQSLSPALRNHPAFPLIAAWENQSAAACLNSSLWRVTCHVGMSYPAQDLFGAFIVWTDAWPGAAFGDFTADGVVTSEDLAAFDAFISAFDTLFPIDTDNAINGKVTLSDFAGNFSVFDLNYDGVVDDRDRSAIQLCGDMNGDRVVDLADLAAFADAILDPTTAGDPCENASPFGACCIDAIFGPDLCFDATLADCQSQDGLFQGVNTTCSSNGCVFPSGACCVQSFAQPTAFCFEATASECLQFDGAFHGVNTTCADIGVNCDNSGNVGACCMNSPAARCVELTATECQSAGGAFQGAGSLCSDPGVPCAIPADAPCCLPFETCVMLDPVTCVNQGGIPLIDAESCAGADCPAPSAIGACCVTSAGAILCLENTATQCFQLGGAWLGENLSCVNAQCGAEPQRACCLPNGGCQSSSIFECLISGGTPQPGGVDCVSAGCIATNQTLGACCVEISGLATERCIVMSNTDCDMQGGVFAGVGMDCSAPLLSCIGPNVPVMVAPTTFVDVLLGRNTDPTVVSAADVDGNSVVDGRDIQPYIDALLGAGDFAIGACCVSGFSAQSVCFVGLKGDCDLAGGAFLGPDSQCDNSCGTFESITMACCLTEGCVDLTPLECAAAGGAVDPDTLTCGERKLRSLLRKCDMNGDNRVNGEDIQVFILRLMEN